MTAKLPFSLGISPTRNCCIPLCQKNVRPLESPCGESESVLWWPKIPLPIQKGPVSFTSPYHALVIIHLCLLLLSLFPYLLILTLICHSSIHLHTFSFPHWAQVKVSLIAFLSSFIPPCFFAQSPQFSAPISSFKLSPTTLPMTLTLSHQI